MKPSLYFLLVLGICAGCSKNDNDPDPGTGTPTNGWKLGANSYTQVVGIRSSTFVAAYDAVPAGSSPAANSFIAYFQAVPTSAGEYTVVAYPASLTAGQVGIAAGLYSSSSTYTSSGTETVKATVTVSGGKVKVVLPEITVKKTGGSSETLKLSGTITEN